MGLERDGVAFGLGLGRGVGGMGCGVVEMGWAACEESGGGGRWGGMVHLVAAGHRPHRTSSVVN